MLYYPIRFIRSSLVFFIVLLWVIVVSPPHLLLAQTPTSTPGPGVPILPAKPTATHTPTLRIAFLIANSYTAPQQVRAQEPFELRLEIRNSGNGMASGYTIRAKDCATNKLQAEGGCVKPLPDLAPGQSAWVAFRLRFIENLKEQTSEALILQLTDSQSVDISGGPDNMMVKINFLPARPIADETPDLKRPFPGPDITIGRTWTAKARSTVAELLTPVPVRLDALPPGGGGPEFELVVELHNQGQVEATNIFVDFCDGSSVAFNPVGSTCRKFVPASLPAGAKAIASQTLAYNNTATPTARGAAVQLKISYEFWYVEQWLKGQATPTVNIYPQEYPAPLLPPYTAPQLKVIADPLNIRMGPGLNYPVVGVARQGVSFSIIGKTANADWWQISFEGKAAWVSGSASLVTVWGGENIPLAASTPPPPPTATPAAKSSAADTQRETAAEAAMSPTVAPTVTLTIAPTVTLTATPASAAYLAAAPGLAAANSQAASAPDTANLSARLAGPWVVIERYRTVPQPIVDGQPFTLELTLRNPGRQTASQLVASWRSNQIAPFGAGGARWLGDLLPGAVTTLSGQFVVTDPRPLGVLQLPVEFSYSDDAGQAHTARDEITLLRPTPRPPTDATARGVAATPTSGRPLWLSALLGFLGLGGQSR